MSEPESSSKKSDISPGSWVDLATCPTSDTWTDHGVEPLVTEQKMNNFYGEHLWPPLPADIAINLANNSEIWFDTTSEESELNAFYQSLSSTPSTSSATAYVQSTNAPSSFAERKKRPRVNSHNIDDRQDTLPDSTFPDSVALEHAKRNLSNCSWKDINLSFILNFSCNHLHAFALTKMGEDPLDYFGASLRRGKFEAVVVEPFSGKDRRDWLNRPTKDYLLTRPPGKSLHLVFTHFPMLAPAFSLESGFALLTVCRRKDGRGKWEPQCFASFEDPACKSKKVTGEQICFVGNLDRCIGIKNGKRVWGQRTSHVQHSEVTAKPMRIAPKGSTKNFKPEDQFCILISLHDLNGRIMSDDMGNLCFARTNPFNFQEKRTNPSLQYIIEEIDKLSIAEKTSLANSAPNREMALLLLANAIETQEAAGLFSNARVDNLPLTACPLKTFQPIDSSILTPEYKIRLQHVATLMGHLHADPDLTCKHPSFLKSGNVTAASGRYMILADTGLKSHQTWLSNQGITLNISEVCDRAQNLGTIMSERRYKSHWILCVMNVYPDSIMVDRNNTSKVYCLAEEGRESPLEVLDRFMAIARLAFTSRIPRAELKETLLTPYKAAFESRNKSIERADSLERFWLLLHAIHCDYFLYWIKFRNAEACKRIEARLREEDALFDESFFGPDRFKKFE